MIRYANYEEVDQESLQNDIDKIKKLMGVVDEQDYKHLLKLEKWGRSATVFGFLLIIFVIILKYDNQITSILFWSFGILGSFFISIGNVSRWANVTHPILHGAYDKVPNIPARYTKNVYANGHRRWLDWLDWIKPDAWMYEHNIMHHYHLGEEDDPDNVEKNLKWLHQKKMPIVLKYITVYIFASMWKVAYYAPNTLRILENKQRIKRKEKPSSKFELTPFTTNGRTLWREYLLPYGIFKFIILPSLFFPLGMSLVLSVFMLLIISEILANLHSFLVIVPNHSAEDIYQFSMPHKTQGEYYLRQIMGSVNYNSGTDLLDFMHGFLNYQIEHHLFPNMPHSFYQRMQPYVKEICKKHNLEYRQESVFKRVFMTIDLMVGKTKVMRVDSV